MNNIFRKSVKILTGVALAISFNTALFSASNAVHADDIDVNNITTSRVDTDSVKTEAVNSVQAKRNAIADLAKKEVGKPYIYGATGPSAFDCSGLAQYVYHHAVHQNLPRTTYAQVHLGKQVSLKHLQKGDLLFWGGNSPYHVGIYVGNGTYVHAATPSQGVRKQALNSYFYPSQAKRIID